MTSKHLRRSVRQEERGASVYGLQRHRGSGNGMRKNDGSGGELGPSGRGLSVEFKSTTAKSFRLTLVDLLVAEKHALLSGYDVLFGIDFLDERGETHRYVVQTEEDYLLLQEQRDCS
jgi:hypothetical protein